MSHFQKRDALSVTLADCDLDELVILFQHLIAKGDLDNAANVRWWIRREMWEMTKVIEMEPDESDD